MVVREISSLAASALHLAVEGADLQTEATDAVDGDPAPATVLKYRLPFWVHFFDFSLFNILRCPEAIN